MVRNCLMMMMMMMVMTTTMMMMTPTMMMAPTMMMTTTTMLLFYVNLFYVNLYRSHSVPPRRGWGKAGSAHTQITRDGAGGVIVVRNCQRSNGC